MIGKVRGCMTSALNFRDRASASEETHYFVLIPSKMKEEAKKAQVTYEIIFPWSSMASPSIGDAFPCICQELDFWIKPSLFVRTKQSR